MGATFYAVVLSATLLLAGSWRVAAQDALFTSERNCTADVWSLCARVMPGGGRVFGCLHLHVGELSVVAVRRFCRRPPGPPRSAPAIFGNFAPTPRSAAYPPA
jgi:hypothetical protein